MNALIRLLRHDEPRREVRDANCENVREFDLDSVACEYLVVLKQMAVAARSGHGAAHLRPEK
jgi:hypothetical protein